MEQKVDVMTMTILEDGTIRNVVEGISGVNHSSAESLVKDINAKTGTKAEVVQRKRDSHAHVHEHEHARSRS